MGGYTPVWDSILSSSLLLEDLPTRWLWIVMLIMADAERDDQGFVDTPVERLAQIANLSLAQTKKGLEALAAPDTKSRGKTGDGSRIIPVKPPPGFEVRRWQIVNWEDYKKKARLKQVAAAVWRYEQKKKEAEANQALIKANQCLSNTNPPTPTPTPTPTPKEEYIRDTAPEGAARAAVRPERNGRPTLAEVTAYINSKNLPVDPVAWLAHYESNGWRVGRNPMKNWKAAVWTWARKEES